MADSWGQSSGNCVTQPTHGCTHDAVPLAVAVREATALGLKWCLNVGCAWSDARLQGRGNLIVHRSTRPGERHAADVKALHANAVAVVELAHEQEELRLCSRIFCNNLVHSAQRRHPRLRRGQITACSRLSNAADADVLVRPRAIVEQLHQGAARVREVRRGKEVRRSEQQIVAMPIETKRCLPPFRAWDIGCTEK